MQPVDAPVPVLPAAGATLPGPPAAPAGGAPGTAGATGLTALEAADRLRRDGPNAIGGSGRRTRLAILVAQLASPLVLILVGAALVSLVVGDDVNASIILAIVVMSAARNRRLRRSRRGSPFGRPS
jgi:magnesium-transporting ATPase (P-type)